jgi:hypothetical protein
MITFSPAELDLIDRQWRSVASDHVWTGWSAFGEAPDEVIIYRTRAHWRKFPLRKASPNFSIFTEQGEKLAVFSNLEQLTEMIESLPGLNLES